LAFRLANITRDAIDRRNVQERVLNADMRDTGKRNAPGETSEFYAESVHDHISMWEALEPSTLVLDTIRHGYSIPFDKAPEPPISVCDNNKSARDNASFVEDAITELLQTGVSRFVSPLSVVKGKKMRLVLDLSLLKEFVAKEKVKFEDMATVMPMLPDQGFMTSFDFKNGYHHVKIAAEHQKFLGFKWKNRLYKFSVLPFGLCSAPHIFTKMLRPFIRKWRLQGKGIAIYLDDGFIWSNSRESCSRDTIQIKEHLTQCGWFFSQSKCHWLPEKKCEWLGFVIDLDRFVITLSSNRVERAKKILHSLSRNHAPSLRDRLRWMGTLASMKLVIPDKEKRRSRAVETAVAHAQSNSGVLSPAESTLLKLHQYGHDIPFG
ncbi:reverse transcriptase, partial [Ancylostoma caninum]